ncbi:MAG: efflux RND transporter permease subunit [Halieaceae bacterium]|nr:efflux RND transporter permease subunit [Halieaceae bacterium]
MDPIQERGIIAWMAGNPVAANLLMLVIMVGGVASLGGITKEVFPTYPSETLTITVPYPGSSPEEVEEGIVLRIEDAIQDIVGVDEIRSVAREGVGVVTVQLEPGTPMAKALGQVKSRVDGITAFPLNAEEPVIDEVLSRTRAMRLTLYGSLEERQLKDYAQELRDEVLAIPGITQVSISGERDYEVSIEVSDTSLRRYGLGFTDVVRAVQARSRDLPGGKLRTDDGSITLRSVGQAYTGEEFADLTLITRDDGTRIALGDVATVRDTFADQPVLSRLNGKASLTLEVDRVGDQDVLAITRQLREFVESKQAGLPHGVELTAWSDRSVILKGRIELMLSSAVQGALLVLITLALFLDLRLAFWVMLGVPFSILGSLLAINLLGLPVSINVISVFGFILVLGMLVDDGIVTAESAYTRLEQEGQGVDSIVRGVRQVAVATIFGAMTTMIAFVPALFLDDGMARFFSHIAVVVIFCLAFSLLETKLILPAHLRHLRIGQQQYKPGSLRGRLATLQQACARGLQRFADTHYRRLLERAVGMRYTTLAIFLGGLLVCLALVPAGIVRFVFFPSVPSDQIFVSLKMPQGTPWQLTHAHTLRIEEAARAMDERYREETGSAQSVIQELMSISTEDTESQVTVELLPSTERDITSVELARWMRESLGELSGVQSLIFNANAGPSGSPVDIELAGRNLDSLRAAAAELKVALKAYEGVFDIRDSFDAGAAELDIRLTPEGDALGLGQVELATQVRQAFFGAEIQRVQRGRNEVRVYVRFPVEERATLESLRSMWIDVPGRGKVPFEVVGEARERTGVSAIKRFDRQRVVNVEADVDKSLVEPGVVNQEIVEKLLPQILSRYPGVSSRLSGEAEEEAETTDSLGLGAVAILIMIYAALAIPLRSYGQPLLIMSVIPFGITGAILGHFILGNSVSILSAIGMIGLSGIVVNDSLVLVDHINERLRSGAQDWRQAVIEGGVRRFRPVLLTSITTFMGLLPIQLEASIQAQFVKPMAISIAFGVLFATAVTLFLVPVLYYVGRDIRQLLGRIMVPGGEPEGDSAVTR